MASVTGRASAAVRGRAHRELAVAALSVLVLASPVAAQSPSADVRGDGASAEATACDALLTTASIASVMDAQVIGLEAGSVTNGAFVSPRCVWSLSDGSTIHIDTLEELGRSPGYVDKFLALGGSPVSGLPAPNAGLSTPDYHQLVLGRVGPLLAESIIFSGNGSDGTPIDLATLRDLAQASVDQPAAPPVVDPTCAGFLPIAAVAIEGYTRPSRDGGRTDASCGYAFGDGTSVALKLEWTPGQDAPDCCSRVKALGKGAFAQQNGTGKKSPWQVSWVLGRGDPELVATLVNGGSSSRTLGKADLIAIAQQVVAGSIEGPGASPGPAVTSVSPEAAALLAGWRFPGLTGSLKVPAGLDVTVTFEADGSATVNLGCTPSGKKQPLTSRGTFSADATNLDVTWPDHYDGACKEAEASDFAVAFGFTMNLLTSPGSWSVSGDTLTLTGTSGPAMGKSIDLVRTAS